MASQSALVVITIGLLVAGATMAAETPETVPDWKKAEATEVWSPVPKAVETPEGKAPSDAIILFDGKSLEAWESAKGGPAKWTLEAGTLLITPGKGDIRTKTGFCDLQLHVEWMTPHRVTNTEGKPLTGQARNNSGVFLQERYEVQILDSYQAETYVNGQAGAIYKQSPPLVNASRAPGQWQSYDIIFTAPKFATGGALTSPARVTVLHNGVLVQHEIALEGPTSWIGQPPYEAHGCAPLRLQDHGNPLRFRNIWVRRLD